MRPTHLGRYEVIAKIAGGGQSAIYLGRALDPEWEGDRVVALKIIREDLRGDDVVDRMFLDEGKLLGRMVHPNVVRTLEVGTCSDRKFIAMELLLGMTLGAAQETCTARGLRLQPDAVAWIAARIGDALHYAHELRDETGTNLHIIHRDVNPANVFVTFDGNVKLFDFGMAKAHGRYTKSAPGIVKGKLPYISPEQIMQLSIDRRSDVFGLGVTIWEMLTGQRLFRRESDAETLRAVHCGPIPDPRTYAKDIPEELVAIVLRALARNRDHRWPTAHHVSRELDAFVARGAGHVPARLAAMLDELFPTERKRQMGWLKPAITVGGGARASLIPSSRR